jgi:hypothetical protein
MATVWPLMFRAPLRPNELALAVTVQFTELPTTEAEAHGTLELTAGALQPIAAEAVIVPEAPLAATFRTLVLKLYGQIPFLSLKTKPS